MKKFRYLGIVAIVIFSFYYTEKIAFLTLENNAVYKKIKSISSNYETSPVNAIITDNYIIPGLNGKSVDIKSSYYNMKDINTFNSYYLIYNNVYPEVSLKNNLDKVINKGNPIKLSVSFIIEYDPILINYFKTNNIPASILIDKNTFNKKEYLEQINNDINNYKGLDSLLNHYNKNTNVCYLSSSIEKECKKNNKYLVKTDKVLNNKTLLDIKNNISSGDIYYVEKNTNPKLIQLLLNNIMYKDLDIVSITKMISEDRN